MNQEGLRRPRGQRCFPGAWGHVTSLLYGSCEVKGRTRAQEPRAKLYCSGMAHKMLLTLVALLSLPVQWANNRGLWSDSRVRTVLQGIQLSLGGMVQRMGISEC